MNNPLNKLLKYYLIFWLILPFLGMFTFKYLAMPPIYIQSAFTYLLVILIIFNSKNRKILLPKYLLAFLIFVIYHHISEYDAYKYFNFTIRNKTYLGLQYFLRNDMLLSFLILFICENVKILKKDVPKIIKLAKYVFIISLIVMIIQATIDPQFLQGPRTYFEEDANVSVQRLDSIYSWVMQGSLGLTIPFYLAFIFYINKVQAKTKLESFFYAAGGLILSFLSKYRSIMLSMILILGLTYRNIFRRFRTVKMIALMAIALLASYYMLESFGVNVKKIYEDRIIEKDKDFYAKSASSRISAFKYFSILFPKNPIWGHGPYLDSEARRVIAGRSSQIHVGFLSLLYYYGIIGSLPYFLFLVLLLKRLNEQRSITNFHASFFAWISFISVNFTSVVLSFFEAGIAFIMIMNNYLNENETS